MYKTSAILVVFSLAVCIVSCQKKELTSPKTPGAIDDTKIKAGVMAKVNDLDFISAVNSADTVNLIDPNAIDSDKSIPYYAAYGSDGTSLTILADGQLAAQDSLQLAGILLWVTSFKGVGNYSISEGSSTAFFSVLDSADNLRTFVSGGLPSGNVKISYFDSAANIISGSFEFTAMSNDSLLVVKNGVFNSLKIN